MSLSLIESNAVSGSEDSSNPLRGAERATLSVTPLMVFCSHIHQTN